MLASLWGDLRPFVLDIVGVLVAVWLVPWLRTRFLLDLDEKHRATLEAAFTNAVGRILAGASTAEAVRYVERGAPDAIAHFKLSIPQLIEKLEAKQGLIAAGAEKVVA